MESSFHRFNLTSPQLTAGGFQGVRWRNTRAINPKPLKGRLNPTKDTMTLLSIYNYRELYRSVSIDGLGLVAFTGNVKGGGQTLLIEVSKGNGRKSWEQGNCNATARARYKGTSPVPLIVRQLDKSYKTLNATSWIAALELYTKPLKGRLNPTKDTMTTTIPQRYFAYDLNTDIMDIDLVEIDKQTFDSIEGEITTERHTMFTNGCNQICHTKENY